MTSEFALATSAADSDLLKQMRAPFSFATTLARVEKNKLSFHRNPMLGFSLPPAATIQRIAMSPLIDSRLHPDAWRFDTLRPHHARAGRKSRRLGRYNSPVAQAASERR